MHHEHFCFFPYNSYYDFEWLHNVALCYTLVHCDYSDNIILIMLGVFIDYNIWHLLHLHFILTISLGAGTVILHILPKTRSRKQAGLCHVVGLGFTHLPLRAVRVHMRVLVSIELLSLTYIQGCGLNGCSLYKGTPWDPLILTNNSPLELSLLTTLPLF